MGCAKRVDRLPVGDEASNPDPLENASTKSVCASAASRMMSSKSVAHCFAQSSRAPPASLRGRSFPSKVPQESMAKSCAMPLGSWRKICSTARVYRASDALIGLRSMPTTGIQSQAGNSAPKRLTKCSKLHESLNKSKQYSNTWNGTYALEIVDNTAKFRAACKLNLPSFAIRVQFRLMPLGCRSFECRDSLLR